MQTVRILTAVLTLNGTILLAQENQPQPEETSSIAERQSVEAHEFMVAAANPLAAQAGYDVLKNGGTAVDAAVALQMVLNLVEPQSSGIGGGAFFLYWDGAEKKLTSFDGRETAPLAADTDYWLDDAGEPKSFWDAVIGGRSVGVPGTLKLMETVHTTHGQTPWADLMQPAITLSETGFPISPRLADAIEGGKDRDLAQFDATREYFFRADGTPKQEGDLLQNPQFGATLRLIAEEGSAPFYEGQIALDIVDVVQTAENPGLLTTEDLAKYRVIERDPVCLEYREWDVCGMGPPSSGALTVGQILGILENGDPGEMGPGTEATHMFLEASKLAFADRGLYMADSDFVDMPSKGLLDDDYLASRFELIDPNGSMEKASPGEPPWEETRHFAPDTERPRKGTTHFVIVDSMGNMVSATSTIESGFGSRLMTNGFLLNNELTDFSFVPEKDGKPVANRVEAGKRPRSSMAPTVVLRDGAPVLLIGSPGGSRIIPYVALSIVGILDFGMDPQDAIDRPHVLNRNGATDVEEGLDAQETAESLATLGHEINIRNLNSGLHAILFKDGAMIGAADKRREGVALGD